MCGVPVERSDEYLHRLIALGHRVAVCEQIEDPAEAKKRGAQERGAARRRAPGDTPGTLTEDTLLDARRNNYLLAIARAAVCVRRRGALRACLDRHLDRRVPHHRMRRCRACRRDRAARAGRDHRLRRALRRCRDRTAAALAASSHAAHARRVRRRHRRAAARRYFAVATTDAFGIAVAARTDGGGGLRHLCRAHAARQAPAAVAAAARRRGRDAC